MMAAIDWNLQKYDGEFKAAGMKRVKAAADIIRDEARRMCKVGTVTRGPAKKYVNADRKLVPRMKSPSWMERYPGEMRKTIRTVTSPGTEDREVRVYAGTWRVWWATQMEFGRGAWKGKAQPFLRPALRASESKLRSIIESGNGETG